MRVAKVMKGLAEMLYEDCEGGKVWRSHSASRWSGGRRWHKETVRHSDQRRMDVRSKKSKEAWEMVTPVGCASMEKGDMVCLCASHMNTLGRWERFMQMLTSWKEQTVEVPLIVSMSFEESVEDVISLPELEGLTIIRQKRKMSQFEHYKALAELDWGDGTWVMFTDDDDLCAPSARGGVRDHGPRMQETGLETGVRGVQDDCSDKGGRSSGAGQSGGRDGTF